MFGITWARESTFLIVNFMKSKYRISISNETLELKCALMWLEMCPKCNTHTGLPRLSKCKLSQRFLVLITW